MQAVSRSLALCSFIAQPTRLIPFALLLLLASAGAVSRAQEYSASEWLKESVQNEMPASDILALLNGTVAGAGPGVKPVTAYPLRQGLYVTAIPRSRNIILRFELDRSSTGQHYRFAEVAITADLGKQFYDFVQAALATATSVFSSDQFEQSWELALTANSYSGGQLTVRVQGDASAHFTLIWELASPMRPISSFTVPTAFSKEDDSEYPNTEYMSAVVHFPLTLDEFQFLSNIYGIGTRFNDFPLYPHNWVHLTVTNAATNDYVNVHFDAITTSGARVFIAEAPASIDVGSRFLDETFTRMQQTLNGAPGKWTTQFPYQASHTGIVRPSVTGDSALVGVFDVAYQLQTSTQYVTRGHKQSQ
jgi:hypothetical protein